MRELNIIIRSCSECPYSIREDYDDIGVDFGMSYICKLGADFVGSDHISSDFKPADRRNMTKEETETIIRKDCPLNKYKNN